MVRPSLDFQRRWLGRFYLHSHFIRSHAAPEIKSHDVPIVFLFARVVCLISAEPRAQFWKSTLGRGVGQKLFAFDGATGLRKCALKILDPLLFTRP